MGSLHLLSDICSFLVKTQPNMRSINFLLPLLFASSVITTACQNTDETSGGSNETGADLVLHNAKIYTVHENQPWAEAIAVTNGEITFIGTDEGAEAFTGDNTEVKDLGGKMIMPGIHDVHLHPLEAASENYQFILDDTVEDPENFADDIADAHAQHPGTGWLLGWGHPLETLLEADRMPKEIIDDVVSDRPVGIMEQTSHSFWCNSKALEVLGFDENTPNPVGGILLREANGELSGILVDNAGELLLAAALAPTPERFQNDYNGLVEYALPELAKYGITSISEARTYWKRNHEDVWKKIESDGELTCRVNLGLWLYPAEEDASQLAAIKALYENNQNKLLKINQVKVYADGIIHSTTAAMHDDYLVDFFGEATNNGLNYFTEGRLAQYIAELEPIGFDFHIHAIGNRGISEALNAIEQSGTAVGRHRLTHVEFVRPEDYARFAELNVTADCQVAGDFTQPDHWHENEYLVGPAVADNFMPLKSLFETGARLTLSSDWDVSTLNPFVGLQNAVTRAPQNLSLEEAVKAYTINAAYVMRQEQLVGSLEVGKLADFIVLDQNIFEIPVSQIKQTKVEATYLEGELIFER